MSLLGLSVEESIIRQVAGARPLSEISLDKLWTRLEAEPLTDLESLARAETLRRIIELRTPADGWFHGSFAEFLIASDCAGETDATFTVNDNGLVLNTGVLGTNAFIIITIPDNYECYLEQGRLHYTGNQTIDIDIRDAGGNIYVLNFMSEALNNTEKTVFAEHSGGDSHDKIPMGPGSQFYVMENGGGDFTAAKVITWNPIGWWRRRPTWVARE